MERVEGFEIPQTLEEACHPERLALLVYDMQIAILRQIELFQVAGAGRQGTPSEMAAGSVRSLVTGLSVVGDELVRAGLAGLAARDAIVVDRPAHRGQRARADSHRQ
jgi:hypothetical protein